MSRSRGLVADDQHDDRSATSQQRGRFSSYCAAAAFCFRLVAFVLHHRTSHTSLL